MRFSAESDEAHGDRNLLSFAVGRVTQETNERRHMSSRARSQVALHSSPGHTRPRHSTHFHLLLALAVAASATATVAATARADTVDLAPVADTSVDSGTEATWDHGASAELEVEQSP